MFKFLTRCFLIAAVIVHVSMAFAAPVAIPIEVLEPADRGFVPGQFPVNVGIVLPDGEMTDPSSGALFDDRGRNVPFTSEVTAWWDAAHTSVKWLLLRFNADGDRQYRFVPGGQRTVPEAGVVVVSRDDEIHVDTGPLQVSFRQNAPRLFESVMLNGNDMLAANQPEPALTLSFANTKCDLLDWHVQIEEASGDRAVLKATGRYVPDWHEQAAALEVRYYFYRGESFVRIEHTLTWMLENPRIGAKELNVGLRAAWTDDVEQLQGYIGLGEVGSQSLPFKATGQAVYIHQDQPNRFTVAHGNEQIHEGEQIAGWMTTVAPDGRGIGIVLRDAWQTYPTAMSVSREEGLRLELWPTRSKPMGFRYEDIMPSSLFHAEEWKRYKPLEVHHMTHEWADNPYFHYTPQGTARTHEMVVHFFDESAKRTTQELNSLTQQPMVLRQEPVSALRVSQMGLPLSPVDSERYPVVERAIDRLGRMVTARWHDLHDYGFWRFGMIRWGSPPIPEGYHGLYRWFDGVQYDQQLIPWILFLRGGDRHFFVEAQRVSRYAADVHTNHYNTLDVPPGYQAGASAVPFPWLHKRLHKHLKIHFLLYQWRLTGDRRARDVIDMMIHGAKWEAANDPRPKDHFAYRGRGRELYNINMFWADAWEHTFDPEVKKHAEEWRNLALEREFDKQLGVFRQPAIYHDTGLFSQHTLWPDERIKQAFISHLQALGYPQMPRGGVMAGNRATISAWIYQHAGYELYGRLSWDLARIHADRQPVFQLDEPMSPRFAPHRGSSFWREELLPILSGLSVAHRLNLTNTSVPAFRDGHLSCDSPAVSGGPIDEQPIFAYIRPTADGSQITISVSVRDVYNAPFEPIPLQVVDGRGVVVAESVVECDNRPIENRMIPVGWRTGHSRIQVTDVNSDTVYGLRLLVPSSRLTVNVQADRAKVVMHRPLRLPTSYCSLSESDTVLYTKTTSDSLEIANNHRRRYAIRDAKTWELLYQTPLEVPEKVTHDFGADRPIALIVAGTRMFLNIISGVEPYFSTSPDDWFKPASPTTR